LLALIIYPLLRWQHHYLPIAVAVVLMGVIESIHFLPQDQLPLRAITALFCGHLFFCIVDFVRYQYREQRRATFLEYFLFLIPFPVLLVVFRAKQRRFVERPPLTIELRRILSTLPISFFVSWLALQMQNVAVFRDYFLLDHFVKLILFVIFLETTAQWLLGLEHLFGFATRPIVNFCFLSRTPGEFWQRYNNRIHDWLYYNVFVTSGGRRKPIRGIMLVFLVSAILHELMFGIVLNEFTGYQAAFFLLQIPAVLISPRMDRLAVAWGNVGKTIARLMTILWFGFTSMLFFHGVQQIFGFFYASH